MAKIVRDWTKWIVPRVNDNNKPYGNADDKNLRRTDSISIMSLADARNKIFKEERQRSLTDFALINDAFQSSCYETPEGKLTGEPWLRSAFSNYAVYFVDTGGDYNYCTVDIETRGICPSLSLRLPSNIFRTKCFS